MDPTLKALQDLRTAFKAKSDQATIAADASPTHDEHMFNRGVSIGFRVAANDIEAAITKLLNAMREAA